MKIELPTKELREYEKAREDFLLAEGVMEIHDALEEVRTAATILAAAVKKEADRG